MSMITEYGPGDAASSSLVGRRDVWTAMRRGFAGHCPACGEGKLFRGFLKVADVCSACGEEMHHQRADDAPPYFPILVVGHVIGAMMLYVEEVDADLPIWIHAIVWPLLTLAMSLVLLPRFKGALIGLQWANRMHGFATALPARVRLTSKVP